MKKMFLVLPLVIALAACKEEVSPAQNWTGKWNGPEGTYMTITAIKGNNYEVTIRNLDEAKTYGATADEDGLNFGREGSAETIRAGNGEATGMKWLTEKKDCLVIKTGEGYCRD